MISTAKKKPFRPSTLALILFILLICFNPFVIVNAGERGVLLQFGEVQEKILGEGLKDFMQLFL
jgi:regulator of protease activity HflC (stomatin/prohibitin superfamily)